MAGSCFDRRGIVPVVLMALAMATAYRPVSVLAADSAEAATTQPSAGHSSHGETFSEGPRSAAYLMTGTGDVHFPVTCASEEAQKFFDQGLGQLHGFWYLESERSFRQVAAIDPHCAMAYWGMAMANINNKQRAGDFIHEAQKRKATATLRPIEAAWIDALSGFYAEPVKSKGDRKAKLVAALKEMRTTFPDDLELKAFLAFYIFEFNMTKENATADKLLDEIFAVAPHHPAHHYRIHLLDTRDPRSALASAAQCGPASPGIAHMWHMPGHIYSDLQRYSDAAWQQEASARVDHAYMIRDRIMPFQIFNYMHNNEWLCRDLLFVGRAHDAMDLAKNIIELPRHPTRGNGAFYGTARLIDTLVLHQMWPEYLSMCESGYLSNDLDSDQLVRKLRFEGVADAALQHNEAADRCIARLREQRKALQPSGGGGSSHPTTQPLNISPKWKKRGSATSTTVPAATRPAPLFDAIAEAVSGFMHPAATQPAPKVDRGVADRLAAIDQAVDHINAEKAMIAGDFSKAATLLTSAKARKEFIALAYLADRNFAKAEELANQAVNEGKEQTYPLATQVLVLHGAGKKAEAAKAFAALRNLSEALDLSVEPYRTLCSIAPDYGFKADYRLARKMPADIRERPPLDSLGPFRWHPSAAPSWTARLPGNSSLSLSQYRGKPVIVLFYLGHGCPHCVRQIHDFATMANQFTAAGISLVAIGTESPGAPGKTWTIGEKDDVAPAFPLASDDTLEIFKAYHCYDAFEKMPLHGTFLIDSQGLIRWQDISYEPFMDAAFLLKESKRLLKNNL